MLKYRILDILKNMTYPERIRTTGILKEKLKLSTVQFSRRINAKYSDSLDFEGMELPTIANELGVKIEELYTPVKKAQSMS